MNGVGWGLIGASTIAREWVIDAIRATGGRGRRVHVERPSRARDYAAENGIPRHTTSLDELLAEPDVEAVYVSTTNELHREQTLAAAAGRQARAVREAARAVPRRCPRRWSRPARSADVVMATNHHLRNAGTHRAMREAIARRADRQAARGARVPCRLPAAASAGLAHHRTRRPAAASCSTSPCTTPTRCASSSTTSRSRWSPSRRAAGMAQAELEDGVMACGALPLRPDRAAPRRLHREARRHRLRGARHRGLADRPRRDDPAAGRHGDSCGTREGERGAAGRHATISTSASLRRFPRRDRAARAAFGDAARTASVPWRRRSPSSRRRAPAGACRSMPAWRADDEHSRRSSPPTRRPHSIPDGAVVTVSSSSGLGCPDAVLAAIGERFEASGASARPDHAASDRGRRHVRHQGHRPPRQARPARAHPRRLLSVAVRRRAEPPRSGR